MPWANGLGVTREIDADQTQRGSTTTPPFRWRVSMADLSAPGGMFSQIPGVDRIIVLLEGSGVTLAVDGSPPRELARLEPFPFSGDVSTSSTVASASGRDLNCMVTPPPLWFSS